MEYKKEIFGEARRYKRLPRKLITEEESNVVFAELQQSFSDKQGRFEDRNFIQDVGDQMYWARMEAVMEGAEKRDTAIFAVPNLDVRRPMRFLCPGHEGATCRVSAAANCLLEFPSLLARVLPPAGNNQRQGMLRFRLWWFGCWEDVYIDDSLPFQSESAGSQVILESSRRGLLQELAIPKLQFMSLEEPQQMQLEMWPFFLEKAVAKIIGSYFTLKSMTFESAISLLMGCDVLSRRISEVHDRQATILLRILTVMQRSTVVFLRQEVPSKLFGCPTTCMLHRTDDIYIVLAFKEVANVLDIDSPASQRTSHKKHHHQAGEGLGDSVDSLQFLRSIHLLVRRVSCQRMPSCTRCQWSPAASREDPREPYRARESTTSDPAATANAGKPLLDMSQERMFMEKGIFWESAAYLLGHFSHADMCLFPPDLPPTAAEDLINLAQLPWRTSRVTGAWVRGKNSLCPGSRRQQATYSPHYVLELWPQRTDQPVLVALSLKQAAVQWRRTNRIPVRLQVYYIGDKVLSQMTRRDLHELKSREQLERRLDASVQLAHRSVFTTGTISELLALRSGSFLILLEVGVPGDETDYLLSAYCSSPCVLLPFQNLVDISYESGTCNPAARIRCREFMPFLPNIR